MDVLTYFGGSIMICTISVTMSIQVDSLTCKPKTTLLGKMESEIGKYVCE